MTVVAGIVTIVRPPTFCAAGLWRKVVGYCGLGGWLAGLIDYDSQGDQKDHTYYHHNRDNAMSVHFVLLFVVASHQV